MEDNEEIKKAVVEVKEMTEDEKMERLAFLRQKAIWDEMSSRKTGERIGRELGEKIGEARGKKLGEKIGEARGKEMGEKIGEARGKKLGAAKGKKEAIENVVKSMMENGIDEETIKKITNISGEELEEIKNKNTSNKKCRRLSK